MLSEGFAKFKRIGEAKLLVDDGRESTAMMTKRKAKKKRVVGGNEERQGLMTICIVRVRIALEPDQRSDNKRRRKLNRGMI